MRKKHRKIKVKFIILIFALLILGFFIWKQNQKITICLDAGHGGTDVRLCG